MQLYTQAQLKKLLANGQAAAEERAGTRKYDGLRKPVVKWFTAFGSATWLISEIDPDNHDRTILTPTTRRRYTRPFRPMKPVALPNVLSGTLRPNTAPSSTSLNVNSAHLRVNVSTGASPIAIPWSLKQRHGKLHETPHLQR